MGVLGSRCFEKLRARVVVTYSQQWISRQILTGKLQFLEDDSERASTPRVIVGDVPSASEDKQLSPFLSLGSLMADCWALNLRERPNVSKCSEEIKWVVGQTVIFVWQYLMHPPSQPSITPVGESPSDSNTVKGLRALEMGRIPYLHARYDAAEPLFQQVLNSSDDTNNEKERAEALYWLGTVSVARCRYPQAEQLFKQAETTYVLLGDDMGRANTLRGLGDTYHLQSTFRQAEEFFTQARGIYDALGDDQECFSQAHEIYCRVGAV